MIKTYIDNIPLAVNEEIRNLIYSSGLDEPFDWISAKYFIIGRHNNKLVGLVVYGEIWYKDIKYPRFLHIIISPEFRRTKTAYKMLCKSEEYFKNLGFRQIICYIDNKLKNRIMKRKYALKFGYEKYTENTEGEFFYKNIGEKQCVDAQK